MTGRHGSVGQGYRYGMSGKEHDDEIKGEGNSLDFGNRIYDPRIGRFLSTDAHEQKYPSITPYAFVNNMPIWAIDPDGNDIIILSAPSGANGMGHGAVLIGNDTDGWKFYSKNGTEDHGSSGASHAYNDGTKYKTLQDFANSEDNFVHGSQAYYTSAFRISSSTDVDKKMRKAASSAVKTDYDLLNASCIDVPSDALKAGGFDPGYSDPGATGETGREKVMADIPNKRYKDIVKNNSKGKDVTSSVQPTSEVLKLQKTANGEGEIEDKGLRYSTPDSDNTRVVNKQQNVVTPMDKDGAKQKLTKIRSDIKERGKSVN